MEGRLLDAMKSFQEKLSQVQSERSEYQQLYQTLEADISQARKAKVNAVSECVQV